MPDPTPGSEKRSARKELSLTTPSQVTVQLEGAMVIIPLDVYDALLTAQLAIKQGEYVKTSEVEQRVKDSVDRAMRAMARTLEREVASASHQQNPTPAEPEPLPRGL